MPSGRLNFSNAIVAFCFTAASFVAADSTALQPTTTAPSATTEASTPTGNVNPGVINFTGKPSRCTLSVFPYQTNFDVSSGQMNVEDDSSWWNNVGTNWTFTTDTEGVNFGAPSHPGQNAGFQQGYGSRNAPPTWHRVNASSFVLEIKADTAGRQLFWDVFQGDPTKEIANSTVATYASTVTGAPLASTGTEAPYPLNTTSPTLTSSGTATTIYPTGPIDFHMIVSGSGLCDGPVVKGTCHNNTIPIDTSSWDGLALDDWVQAWFQNAGAFADGTNPMQQLSKQYMVGQGKSCTYNDACDIVSTCDQQGDNGSGPDGAEVYLTWISLQNLSDFIFQLWQAIGVAQGDTATSLGALSTTFWPNQPPKTPWYAGFSKAGAIVGTMSPLVGLIPGAAPIAAGVGSIGGIVSGLGSLTGDAFGAPAPDKTFQNAAQLEAAFGNLTIDLQQSIETLHDNIFTRGQGLPDVLKGGAFVDRTQLNLDSDHSISAAQAWLEQYLALRTINYAWSSQNVFITFVPYGPVAQLTEGHALETEFTQDDCEKDFLPDNEDLVVCDIDDAFGFQVYTGAANISQGGMARLTWYNKGDESNRGDWGHLTLESKPPGHDSGFTIHKSGYKFDATDAIKGSVRSWVQHGFNWDEVGARADKMIQSSEFDDFTSLSQIAPADVAYFNLPVCVMYDLRYVPPHFNHYTTDVDSICICDTAANADSNGVMFADAVKALAPDLEAVVRARPDFNGDIVCDPERLFFRQDGYNWDD